MDTIGASQPIHGYYYEALQGHESTLLLDFEWKEASLLAYEQAIALAPRAAVLHYHKGQILDQLGRLAEARRAYEEARRLGYHS